MPSSAVGAFQYVSTKTIRPSVMLAFKDSFGAGQSKGRNGGRVRILGETVDGRLLWLVHAPSGSSIELVSADGSSITVLLCNVYRDFVSADLSDDTNLLHATYRVCGSRGFAFVSSVYDIQSFGVSCEFPCNDPIFGFFIGELGNTYGLVHVFGGRIVQLSVTREKKAPVVSKIRGGVHMTGVVWWKFYRSTTTMQTIYSPGKGSTRFIELRFDQKPTQEYDVQVLPKGVLPSELALVPVTPVHRPVFRGNLYRMFVKQHGTSTCMIQQIFDGADALCAFAVITQPRKFHKLIYVPGVPADVPICFGEFSTIVAVFVPGEFLYLIDFGLAPPNISPLPKGFAAAKCGKLCDALPEENRIVNLETGRVYEMSFSFENTTVLSSLMTRTSWDAFAQICARLIPVEGFADILRILERRDKYEGVATFFRDFFSYSHMFRVANASSNGSALTRTSSSYGSLGTTLPSSSSSSSSRSQGRRGPDHAIIEQIRELDRDVPMASGVPWIYEFERSVSDLVAKGKARSYGSAAKVVIRNLQRYADVVRSLRDVLDSWEMRYSPDPFCRTVFGLVILSETMASKFPSVPGVKEEIEGCCYEEMPLSVCRQLARHQVISVMQKEETEAHEAKEVSHWRRRMYICCDNSRLGASTWRSRHHSVGGSKTTGSDVSDTSETMSVISWLGGHTNDV